MQGIKKEGCKIEWVIGLPLQEFFFGSKKMFMSSVLF